MSKSPVRSPHDTFHLMLKPEDGQRVRRTASRYGMTIVEYFTTLVRGEAMPAPMPAAFSQLGACVTGALAALQKPEPDVAEAIRLLGEAKRHGAAITLTWVPGYDAAVALREGEDDWSAPDTPRRAGS
jgi:hypothetical protein